MRRLSTHLRGPLRHPLYRPASTLAPQQQQQPEHTPRTKPYFVSTPIYYVNAAPHIGHLYSSLVADCVSRFHRVSDHNRVLFSTGTDEHGQKIQHAAAGAGLSLPNFCDRTSGSFRRLHTEFDIRSDEFVRTVEPRHAAVVRWLWRRLVARKAIYMGSHSGWYCQSDETFLTDMQVVPWSEYCASEVAPLSDAARTNAPPIRPPLDAHAMVSAESGHPVARVSEENYMFRMSQYQNDVMTWLQNETSDAHAGTRGAILPHSRMREVAAFVGSGLNDLSVSRRSDKVWWAIPVPDDPSHSVYVWVDALCNYLTAAMRGGAYAAPLTDGASTVFASGTTSDGATSAAAAAALATFSSSPTSSSSTSPISATSAAGAGAVSTREADTPPTSFAADERELPLAADERELPLDADWRDIFPAWPADMHVVGKDILKFHAVYWPALLIAAGLPPPARIVAHGHWTSGHVKMSKSLGNVVSPRDLIPAGGGEFDVDSVRYFLLRKGSIGSDCNFSIDEVRKAAHSECADTFGNLASRVINRKLLPEGLFVVTTPAARDDAHSLPSPVVSDSEAELASRLSTLRDSVAVAYASADAASASEQIMDTLALANRVFAAAQPWLLVSQSASFSADAALRRHRLSNIMFLMLETLRICSILLQPVMPTACEAVLARLGVGQPHALSAWSSAVYGAAQREGYAVDTTSGPFILFAKRIPPPATSGSAAIAGGTSSLTLRRPAVALQ